MKSSFNQIPTIFVNQQLKNLKSRAKLYALPSLCTMCKFPNIDSSLCDEVDSCATLVKTCDLLDIKSKTLSCLRKIQSNQFIPMILK